MVPPDSLILLAGFVLAHAAWSVSDLPRGELLVPLAVVVEHGQRQLLRFEAQTQEQAIAEGKTTLANRQAQLDAWAKGMGRPITFVQRFRPYSSGSFRITGDVLVVVDGKVLEGTEAARAVSRLYDGGRQRPKAGQLWQGWRAK